MFLILFSLLLNTQAQTIERVQRAEAANKTFRELNFFKDGGGMTLSPNVIKLYEGIKKLSGGKTDDLMKYRWGMNVIDGEVMGFFNVPYNAMNVGVLGCVACHSGKAAGEYIVGLGNKNIDVGQIGIDAYNVELFWSKVPAVKTPDYLAVEKNALRFSKNLSNPKLHNLTQGLVPISMIRTWFYEQANTSIPENMNRAQAKVPHMWGYGEKRKVGSFCDGFGNGELGGWAIAVELFAGQKSSVVKSYLPKIHQAEDVLGDILPPKYPFAINAGKAGLGKMVYERSCQKCHGTYERDGNHLAVFQAPKHIPFHVVKTDEDRLLGNDPQFYQLVATNPLNDIIQSTNLPKGYFAPRLEGVWARFPYLHNGSVPTIYELISEPGSRSKMFSLTNAGEKSRFDEKNLGLTNVVIAEENKTARSTYDTSKPGHSNQGHYFESFKTLTVEDKYSLIEYLKTL